MSPRPGDLIVLAPPNPAWATDFEREATAIADALTDTAIALHHIGSTAIPGIVAKPVIDLLGVVTTVDVLDPHARRLATLGYVERSLSGWGSSSASRSMRVSQMRS